MNENNLIDISQNIKNEIKTNDVVLFMKGTPVFPMCGFSAAVVEILSNLDTGMYDVRLNAIEENYERAKKYHSDNDVVPRLTNKIINEVNG